MSAATLESELLAVPGVASAEVDALDEGPAGVKVRLAAEADARSVGVEVQRVLAAHGMRSRFAAPPSAGVTGAPEPAAPAEGVSDAPEPVPSDADEPTVPPVAPSAPLPAGITSVLPDATVVESVVVEERRDEVTVTVALPDGRSGTRSAAFESGAHDAAVAGAALDAATATAPVLAVEWLEADGAHVVTVVVGGSGPARAGAAVVAGGRAYAIAAAALKALLS